MRKGTASPAQISSAFSLAQGALIGRALFASQLDPGQRLRRIIHGTSWERKSRNIQRCGKIKLLGKNWQTLFFARNRQRSRNWVYWLYFSDIMFSFGFSIDYAQKRVGHFFHFLMSSKENFFNCWKKWKFFSKIFV